MLCSQAVLGSVIQELREPFWSTSWSPAEVSQDLSGRHLISLHCLEREVQAAGLGRDICLEGVWHWVRSASSLLLPKISYTSLTVPGVWLGVYGLL